MSNPTGVDVSHWAPVKDWDALIADGRRFIGIKASQGTGFADPTLEAHRDGRRAHAADLLGAIFFHYPSEGGMANPRTEAENFLTVVGELQDDELLALDVEQGKSGRGAPPIDWQREFVSYLPQERGRVPHIYTAKHVWNEIGNPPWPEATLGKVGLWAKQWGPALTKLPSPWPAARLWQNATGVQVPGIDEPCDTDEFIGTLDELRLYFSPAPF